MLTSRNAYAATSSMLQGARVLSLDPPFGEWVSRVASTKKAS